MTITSINPRLERLCAELGITRHDPAAWQVIDSLYATQAATLTGTVLEQTLRAATQFLSVALNVMHYYAPGYYDGGIPDDVVAIHLAHVAGVDLTAQTPAAKAISEQMATLADRSNEELRTPTPTMRDALFLRMLELHHELAATEHEMSASRGAPLGPTPPPVVLDCLRARWPDTMLGRDNRLVAERLRRVYRRHAKQLAL